MQRRTVKTGRQVMNILLASAQGTRRRKAKSPRPIRKTGKTG
jgi:hypothetical protein